MVALLSRTFAALVGGTLLWLSFPDAGLWWAAAPGVALITLATRGVRLLTGALLAVVGGLAMMVPLLRWSGIYVGADAWLALSGFEALYFLLLGLLLTALQRWTAHLGPRLEALVLPPLVGAAWVVQEWVRGTIPWGGFSWGRLAFSQAEAPTLAVARWGTAAGLTAWVGAIGALLAVAALAVHRTRIVNAVGSVAAAGALTAGPLLLPVNAPTGPTLDVLAVQGDAPQSGFRFNENAREVLTNHTSLVEQAAAEIEAGERPAPDVVFLPENASDVDPTRDQEASALLAKASWTIDRPMLVGAILREPSPKVTNAVLQYLPGQGPVARYDKQHPVPFGEWIPHRDLFRRITPKVDLVPRDFNAGQGMGVMDVPLQDGRVPGEQGVRIGMGICFEVAYDDLMRLPVVEGSELLFIPTNNASFGITDQSTQQLAISRVRAMEHARSVVHISTVGVSAVLGPDGAIVSSPDGGSPRGTDLFEPALLSASIPLNDGITLATRLGNWPTWVLSALAVGAAVAGLLPDSARRWRARRDQA